MPNLSVVPGGRALPRFKTSSAATEAAREVGARSTRFPSYSRTDTPAVSVPPIKLTVSCTISSCRRPLAFPERYDTCNAHAWAMATEERDLPDEP